MLTLHAFLKLAHSTLGLSSIYDADVMAAPLPPAKPHRLTPSRGLRKEPLPHLLIAYSMCILIVVPCTNQAFAAYSLSTRPSGFPINTAHMAILTYHQPR